MLHTLKKYLLLGICLFTLPLIVQSQTQVNDSITVEALVEDFFNSGILVDISNITFNGMPADSSNCQIGLFSNGNTDSLNMDVGMVISTGAVLRVTNDSIFVPFDEFVEYSDMDLAAITGVEVYTCAVLEFDVQVNADALAFNYLFASTEYAAYTCSPYNDAFGLFISGPGINGPYQNSAINIATIPNSDVPVAINTVNSGESDFQDPAYCENANPNWQEDSQYFIQNDFNQASSITFNGYTEKFEAYTEVQNGATYHIKLSICNASDGAFDSGVFFEGGSFEGRLLSGVSEAEQPEMSVFPNPASEEVYLKNVCTTCSGRVDIRICDVQGRQVARSTASASGFIPVNVSDLDRGIYLISVSTEAGNIQTGKLVVR